MQLKLNQLEQHLQHKLAPVYLISGDEPLLVQESRSAICKTAQAQGYTTHEILTIEPGFDWNHFFQLTQNLSLFSERTLIDLRTTQTKFEDKGIKMILDYLSKPLPDILLVMSMAKLTGAQQKAKWYQTIAKTGATLPIWPPSLNELPSWIQQRCHRMHLNCDFDAIQLLIDLTEGNLLATQQALEKCKLLYPNKNITPKEMATVLSENTRFNVFDLSNYVLQGDTLHAVRALRQLRFSGAEPPFVLWALTREIRELIRMSEQLQRGTSMQQVLQRQWHTRKTLLQSALRRLTLEKLFKLLQLASRIDQTIKGIQLGNAWNGLTSLALRMCKA